MKRKIRTCDVCGAEIPKRDFCSLVRYKVKVKEVSQYNDWCEKDLPHSNTVDLCPKCFGNLCRGLGVKENG